VVNLLFSAAIFFTANAAEKVNIYLDSSGSIAGLPGGGSYVLSVGDRIVKELEKRGIEVDIFSFDDNVKKLFSEDGYFVNKNGSTDLKGVAEHLKESNVDVAIIVSDGKLPANYTFSYKKSTINTFKQIRKNGVKVCFLSLYRDILPFPKEISDLVEPANKVKQLINECLPVEQKVQKKIVHKEVKTPDAKTSNSTTVVDPFAFSNEVKAKETIKDTKTHSVTINIYQK